MMALLKKVMAGLPLDQADAMEAMNLMIERRAQPEQIGAFLAALNFQEPTAEVLTGFAETLRAHSLSASVRLAIPPQTIDVCGTGGDGLGTFNVSTAVSFVLSAAGVPVAKHGNRASSSRCGSFDVLEALGIPFSMTFESAAFGLRNQNVAFLYAPSFHPILSTLKAVRKNLGHRTSLNALGPLLNPLHVKRQLVGVYDRNLLGPMAKTLQNLGAEEAMVVHGDDGGDEISLSAATSVAHLKEGQIKFYTITPEDVGLRRISLSEIQGGSVTDNAKILTHVLSGQPGSRLEMVILNAGAAFLTAGVVPTLPEGCAMARETLESGRAYQQLKALQQPLLAERSL